MGRIRKLAWKSLVCVLAVLLLFEAVRRCERAAGAAQTVVVFLDDGGLDASAAQQICADEAAQEEALGVCFFGERKTAAQCRETGADTEVTQVMTVGSSELLVQSGQILSWAEDGCLVDAGTAQALFGTERANGQTVWIGERAYRVYGTFSGMEQTVVCAAQPSDGSCLTSVLCKTDREREAEEFLLRYGRSGSTASFFLLQALAEDLLLLPVLILLARLLHGWIGGNGFAGKKNRQSFVALACVGLILTLIWLGIRYFSIPSDLIPTKWSDFSFWPRLWETQKRNLLLILKSAQGEAQLSLLWSLLSGTACTVGASLLAFLI